MVKLKTAGILILAALMFSCSASKKTVYKPSLTKHPPNNKALDHYLAGALYDFQYLYKEALLEYQKALSYDSTSAQILKAIGRNLFRIEQYQRAIQYLNRSLRFNPLDKEALYYLAEAHYRLKNYDEAILYFEKLYAIEPYNSLAQANLIFLYTRTGQIDKLISLREKLVKIYGYEDDSVYQLLTLYMQVNQLDKASKLTQELLENSPEEPANWLIYGNLLELKSDTTAAINAYKKALELNPQNTQPLNELYQVYLRQRDWNGIVETFGKVVAEDSGNARARLLLAEGYFYLEDYDRARETLRPLLSGEAYKEQAHLLMSRIAANQNLTDEAKLHLRELTRLEPWNNRAWEFLAVLHFQEQEYEECAAVLQDALSRFPNEAGLLSLYGSALQQLNRIADALNPLQKAYQLKPDDLNTIVTLGIVYDELKMHSALDSLFEVALVTYPDNALLLNNYSYSLAERGIELGRALKMAKRALELEPENSAYLDTIGWIYYQLTDYEKALQFIRKAVNSRDSGAEVLEHLGDVYLKLGDIDNARKYWKKSLEQDPANETLKNKLQQTSPDNN
jgi:tetratricopeptide (TPR) repeat protein